MHNDYTLLMSLVLDKEATTEEEAELRSHLRGCSECGRTWQRWQEIDRRFEAAPLVAAPAGLAEMVMLRIDRAQVVGARRRRFALWFGIAWTAAIVLTGLFGLLLVNWPLELPPAASAALSALAGAGEWIFALAVSAVTSLGAPAVAAIAGALLCLTCGLGVAWLWIVNQGVAGNRATVTA